MRNRLFQGTALAGLVLGLGLFSLSTAASPGTGEGKKCAMMGQSHEGPKRLMAMEGLTDEQRSQIKAVMQEHRPAMKEARTAFREGRSEVRQAMREGADPESIRPLAQEQGERLAAMIQAKARIKNALQDILGEEQWQELHAGEGKGRHHKGGHGPGHHGGGDG
ncbi:MAG: periplasmic heavy metal sensor [Thiohalospira sp.]